MGEQALVRSLQSQLKSVNGSISELMPNHEPSSMHIRLEA